MESRYDPQEAQKYIEKYGTEPEELALRIYTSHLIGKDPDLVLHGGGNTSVKTRVKNILGEMCETIYIKGSGWDLSHIEPEGFPALDLTYLRRLRRLDSLSDEEMVNQLRTHMLRANSPDPSVEALLHAFLPHRFIDHTHADAILTLTNSEKGCVREALGEKVAIVPYIMPGFPLAKAVAEIYEKDAEIEAIVLLHHGLFTFGDDARTSYERTIHYVDRAERFIQERLQERPLVHRSSRYTPPSDREKSASRVAQAIRGALCHKDEDGALRRFILELRDAPDLVEASLSEEAERLCSTGVLTPDHIIRTKNHYLFIETVPEEDAKLKEWIDTKIATFNTQYIDYFESNQKKGDNPKRRLDPYPRVFLVAGIGLLAAGSTRKEALIAADIAEHTIRAKLKAEALGGYRSLPESDLFEMEYWVLEQKKLGKKAPLPLQGQVALITGGGGAVALGVADRLLQGGAVVILTDIDSKRLEQVRTRLVAKYGNQQLETLEMDVTDRESVERGFDSICRKFGGIDIVVPNAGIAHVEEIEHLPLEKLNRVMEVNFTGVFTTIQTAARIFRRQGSGGNIVVISSKNVFAPSEAFGAYSASKAAAHQLSKISAMELAKQNVRVNMINADAVFGDLETPSGLWETVGEDRMKARGLSAEELKSYYQQRNLLKAEVLAEHIGNAVLFFTTEQTPTTGATLPVDGGIPAAFPR